MPVWAWIVIGIGVVVVIALALFGADRQRSRHLEEKFGPEYGRTVAERGDRRSAESELREREQVRERLEITPLSERQRERYGGEWQQVQSDFVDNPSEAVAEADRLIAEVMRERGYPVDDFEQQAAVVSVDHPDVVANYREGHAIYLSVDRGGASTEDLRQAMQHYRALFDELLENPAEQPLSREPGEPVRTSDSRRSETRR
jgi:predicted nucleic acid-binding protein